MLIGYSISLFGNTWLHVLPCFLSFALSQRPVMSTSNQRSRPPISGLRRPSATAGQFEPLYTTSYITPPHVRRSASDTFLFERSREERQRRAREDERARLIQEAQQAEEAKETLSRFMILCLTICMAGVQFTCKNEQIVSGPLSSYLTEFDRDRRVGLWDSVSPVF